LPVPKFGGTGGIENYPRKIIRTGLGIGADLVWTELGTTPVTQLRQRAGILGPSGKVGDTHIDPIPWVGGLVTLKLFFEQGNQVSWMKTVSNLGATAIEADIF
jgi:hypothetical protein